MLKNFVREYAIPLEIKNCSGALIDFEFRMGMNNIPWDSIWTGTAESL